MSHNKLQVLQTGVEGTMSEHAKCGNATSCSCIISVALFVCYCYYDYYIVTPSWIMRLYLYVSVHMFYTVAYKPCV